jgi:hypothetical protein
MAETTAQSANFYLGVQIELNKKTVNLAPNTPINKIAEQGLKLKLESPLPMGTVKEALPSILDDLSISKENSPIDENGQLKKTGVEFLDKVANKIADANLTIHTLEYQRDPLPKNDNGKPDTTKTASSKYAFVASATWPDKAEKADDFFKLKGIVIGVAKGYSDDESSQTFLAAVGKMNEKPKQLTSGDSSKTIEIDGTKVTDDASEEQDAQGKPKKSRNNNVDS